MKKAVPKKEPTLRTPMSIRFTDVERAAITKAADAEEREPAVFARRIILAWLAEKGFLKSDAKVKK